MQAFWTFVQRHFEKHQNRTPLAFAIWMGMEGLILSMILAVPLGLFLGGREDLESFGYLDGFLMIVVLAPLLETLIFQMLPIALMRWLRLAMIWQILVSTALFAAAHFPSGIATGISVGVAGGFYLAYGYAFWAAGSHWTAFWTTTLQHLIRNLIGFVLMAAFGGFAGPEETLDSNACSGGNCGTTMWYFMRHSDKEFRFAVVFVGDSDRHSLLPMTLDGQIRRRFQISFAGRYHTIKYSHQPRSVEIDEHEFDMSKDNVIVIHVNGNEYSTDKLHVDIDSKDPIADVFVINDQICDAMQSRGLVPARKSPEIDDSIQLAEPTPVDEMTNED